MSTTSSTSSTSSTPAATVRNGVPVDKLFGTINKVTDDPSLAQFRFTARNDWLEGTASRSTIHEWAGAGGEHVHVSEFSFDLAASQSREEKQAELDATCEAAREKRLAPMREQLVEECIREKQRDDRAACEQFHSDFGGQSGRRAPLFYDLPECVEAFDYQQSERSN